MSTGAYIRVSTADQNEASQKREIRKYLKGHGSTDVVWYLDKSTGDNLERPDFQRLERDLFNGETKTVISQKTGISRGRLKTLLNELIADGEIEAFDLRKGNKKTPYQAYKITKMSNRTDQPDSPSA